ncbi:hypothetical protein [Streptomyces fuscichromogenes]|uniref:Uncharacterized protein n=1 Tax=Streptomyces fuscichromogenes TaxID=1324013 RepID=A0A917XQJ5_9ACTN|nr:hypothetical protein [Streptomyces fuscichromogenes]GGN45853.1 hypothetical protein GCM10011578_098200 [Streptomyces fuscichromogenes]
MTLVLVVALALAGGGVYIAYRNPRMGAAILVGLGILTALYLVCEKDPSVLQTSVPPVPAPAATPPAGQPRMPAPSTSVLTSRKADHR